MITITLQARDRSETGRGNVWVEIRNGWTERVDLPVTWEVQPSVEVTPRRLFLGVGARGEVRQGVVTLAEEDGKELKITSAHLDPELQGALVTVAAMSSATANVIVELTLPNTPGVSVSELVIDLASPAVETVRVPLSGITGGG